MAVSEVDSRFLRFVYLTLLSPTYYVSVLVDIIPDQSSNLIYLKSLRWPTFSLLWLFQVMYEYLGFLEERIDNVGVDLDVLYTRWDGGVATVQNTSKAPIFYGR